MGETIRAVRYHDISCGHRVVGHESKCAHLHGHNYRIHFHVEADALDHLGRVMDFSVIKSKLCDWVEDNWDHKFLYWAEDPVMTEINAHMDESNYDPEDTDWVKACGSFVIVSFNPTAENMARNLLRVVGPDQLEGTGVRLVGVTVDETRKCSAEAWA